MKSNLGPPPRPEHTAVDVVSITPRDIVQLANDASLPLVAPVTEWEGIAERLTFAFAGYAAGTQRESVVPSNTRLRDWGAAMSADALRLMARVGPYEDTPDVRQGARRTTELAAEALLPRVVEGGPEVAALAELQQLLQGPAASHENPVAGMAADDVDLLLQLALFRFIPTLRILAIAGEAVEQRYGGLVRRGGSTAGRSIPWLFQELVACFEAQFAVPPKILPPGGRDRTPRDSTHLPWFQLLFGLVRRQAAAAKGPEAKVLRALAKQTLGPTVHEEYYDKLRAWIVQACGNE